MKNMDNIKAKGVDSVACVSVNDPYALDAWAKSQNYQGIEFFADHDGAFTKYEHENYRPNLYLF